MQIILKIIIDEDCIYYKGYSYDSTDVIESIMCISKECVSSLNEECDCEYLSNCVSDRLEECTISFEEISKSEYDYLYSNEDCIDIYIILSTSEYSCIIGGRILGITDEESDIERDYITNNYCDGEWRGSFDDFEKMYEDIIEEDIDCWYSSDEDCCVSLIR